MPQMSQPSRRGLFRSLAQTAQGRPLSLVAMRPPGILDESDFIEQCTRCGDCIRACGEQIIVAGDGGFPELSFESDGCSGCGDCADVCQTSALQSKRAQWPQGDLAISEKCLPMNQVTCQACKDACDSDALVFSMTTKTPIPHILQDSCTSCGQCISHCPVDALSMTPITHSERGMTP